MTQPESLKVIICDDEQAVSDHWANGLKGATGTGQLEITALNPEEVSAAALSLEARQTAARNEATNNSPVDTCPFDDADILIVDYDLLELPEQSAQRSIVGETGERLAYLARCFSKCGYIIALNQFDRSPTFDLTLRGNIESYADLNLCSEDISNPWLWRDTPPLTLPTASEQQYRPWHWPFVSQTARDLAACVKWLLDDPSRLDQPALSLLGLDGNKRVRAHWSTGQLEHLGSRSINGDARTPFEITARDFVEASGHGVKGKDRAPTNEAIARIFTYRIHKWLERHVLPAQEIAIDAPHLVTRLPSTVLDESSLSELCTRDARTADQLNSNVAQHRILEGWTSRPVWDWRTIRTDECFPEVSDPWGAKLSPHVFLEDTSTFADRSAAKPFQASVFGPALQRYTSSPGLPGIAYEPAVRYLIADE